MDLTNFLVKEVSVEAWKQVSGISEPARGTELLCHIYTEMDDGSAAMLQQMMTACILVPTTIWDSWCLQYLMVNHTNLPDRDGFLYQEFAVYLCTLQACVYIPCISIYLTISTHLTICILSHSTRDFYPVYLQNMEWVGIYKLFQVSYVYLQSPTIVIICTSRKLVYL